MKTVLLKNLNLISIKFAKFTKDKLKVLTWEWWYAYDRKDGLEYL